MTARNIQWNDTRIGLENAGVGTWDFDFRTREITLSEATRVLLGLQADRQIEYDSFLHLFVSRDQAAIEDAILSCFDTRMPLDIRCQMATATGVGRWVRLRAGAIADTAGFQRGISGIVLDIEEERRLEEALRAREGLLRSILETVPDAMVVIDEKGIVQFFSSAAERLFGYEEKAAIGMNVNMLMPQSEEARHDQYLAAYLNGGSPGVIGLGRIITGKRRDNSTFPMHLWVGQMLSGGERYFTGFIRDLTEQQQTQAKLAQLQSELVHVSRLSAMGVMLSALAHELNQPFTAISNYMNGASRLLRESRHDHAEKIGGALEKAGEQAIRAGRIIHRLRSFVLRGENEKRVESVSNLVAEASALGLINAREQGVILVLDLDTEHDLVLADRVQIQQVLVNLFHNALEAMRDSPQKALTIRSEPFGERVILVSVSDTGPGFSKEMESELFQTFFTTKKSGMGIGLSISRTIIEAHGGRMWADINDAGGATFRFSLPSGDLGELSDPQETSPYAP